MMYLASLVEETKDKVDGYKFIHTKSELDKIVVDNLSSNKVVIRQDFAHEFFTPTGLMSYIENVRKVNFNIVIELAHRSGVKMSDDELRAEANKWELSHGGISGRTAQQFINYVLGKE